MAERYGKWRLLRMLVDRVLTGRGAAPPAERKDAFDNAVAAEPLGGVLRKVVAAPSRVTEEDIAALGNSGLSDDQVFELVICAAVGQAFRQYESGLTALSNAVARPK